MILIDAVRSGGRPGRIHDLDLSEVSALAPSLVSSHGIGVGEAIELARRLGRLPVYGRFLGIEVSTEVRTIQQSLTDPVAAAVELVLQRTEEWARKLAATIAPPTPGGAATSFRKRG